LLVAFAIGGAGCERGCARGWVERADPRAPSRALGPAVDCPDGLARCEQGSVSASRLASIPQPCTATAQACTCPWDVVGECRNGCVVEGVDVVVDRSVAQAQLCAPERDASTSVMAAVAEPAAARCEEGEVFACRRGAVIDCAGHRQYACPRGCFRDGASLDSDGVSREAAFAILCSR
jgi:hypothetical protein